MAFTQDHHMVQALAPDRANQPFGEWILPGRSRRGWMVTYPIA